MEGGDRNESFEIFVSKLSNVRVGPRREKKFNPNTYIYPH